MSNETTFVFRLQDQTGSVGDGNQGSLAPPGAPSDLGYGVPPGAPPRSTIPFPRARDAGAAAAGQAGDGEIQTPQERLTSETNERYALAKEQQAEDARKESDLAKKSRKDSNDRIREHEADLARIEGVAETNERARVAANRRRFSAADQKVEEGLRDREVRLNELADAGFAKQKEEAARQGEFRKALGSVPVIGRFARVAGPVAAAAGVAAAFRAVDQIGVKRAEELRYLSPEVATATAISEVSLLMRDITSAQKIGGVVAQHKTASTELEIAGKNFADVIAKEFLPAISAQKSALADVINLISRNEKLLFQATYWDEIAAIQKKISESVSFLSKKILGVDKDKEFVAYDILGGNVQTHLPDFPEISGLPQEDRDDLDKWVGDVMRMEMPN